MTSYTVLDSLSLFATEVLKDAATWARYWTEVLDCCNASEVDELLCDLGYGQTWEY